MATPMPPHSWHAKIRYAYSRTSEEAIENAMCIYDLLHGFGWTLNAISGVLGNIGNEGGYNPWRWYGDNVLAYNDTTWQTTSAYGLVQFHPPSKYISDSRAQAMSGYGPNFSDRVGNVTDGRAQMEFVNYYADYAQTTAYPISYTDYKISVDTPENCALIWVYNYERPGTLTPQEENARSSEARYWYDLLSQYDPDVPPTPPIPPTPPTPIPKRKMPVWMMALKRIH